jgi:hypothetical protein
MRWGPAEGLLIPIAATSTARRFSHNPLWLMRRAVRRPVVPEVTARMSSSVCRLPFIRSSPLPSRISSTPLAAAASLCSCAGSQAPGRNEGVRSVPQPDTMQHPGRNYHYGAACDHDFPNARSQWPDERWRKPADRAALLSFTTARVYGILCSASAAASGREIYALDLLRHARLLGRRRGQEIGRSEQRESGRLVRPTRGRGLTFLLGGADKCNSAATL